MLVVLALSPAILDVRQGGGFVAIGLGGVSEWAERVERGVRDLTLRTGMAREINR